MSRIKKTLRRALADAGLWFAFFSIIYVIIVLKVLTYRSIPNDIFFGFYGILVTTYILSRFFLAYFHFSPESDESYEPTVSFVVPAKNEGDNIAKTIRRFGEVNYPLGLIEVIAIDDGSTDQTYEEMLSVQKELEAKGIPVNVVHWEINRGKRHGQKPQHRKWHIRRQRIFRARHCMPTSSVFSIRRCTRPCALSRPGPRISPS